MLKDNDKIIDDDLHIAEKFIKYLNKTYNKDFVLPFHPKEDNSIDALTHRESNPQEMLTIQIVKSDFNGWEALGKEGIYIVSRDRSEKILDTIVNPISHKSNRYSPDFKRDLILLLHGWWTVDEDVLNYFKNNCLDSFFRLQKTGFKEIWFVSERWDGPIYRLWPY